MMFIKFNPGEEWYFEEFFEHIKAFRETGSYSIARSEDSSGYVGIYVSKYDFTKPQTFQQNALNYFNDHQTATLDAICDAIVLYYHQVMEDWEIESYSKEEGFPEINSREDVKKYVGIGNLHLLADHKDGMGYIGFECGCPWDEEHGLGIIVYGSEVIDIGEASLALSSSLKVSQHNGKFYTKEYQDKMREIEETHEEYVKSLNRKKDILFWTALITAIWFAFMGMLWTYWAALVIAYPAGIISYLLWRPIREENRAKAIPIILGVGAILSMGVLFYLLIWD